MKTRKNISSGAPWENIVGYSRAVRIANIIEISGTTSVNSGLVEGLNDSYKQTVIILNKFKLLLEKEGLSIENIIRTRIYVTDISNWELIGKAHGEFFKNIKPATTMVEVSNLINPDMLVEIEATAIID